jgi:hypothetical protein
VSQRVAVGRARVHKPAAGCSMFQKDHSPARTMPVPAHSSCRCSRHS